MARQGEKGTSKRLKAGQERCHRYCTDGQEVSLHHSDTRLIPYSRSRALSVETPTPSSTGKDVFLFSPIFESPEQAVAEGLCGLEQTLEERSKRSSLTSLVWDDECDFTTPYREEEDLEGYESGSSYTTIGESDSRESTPRREDKERAYMETSVRRQGDRLLRDMLQLRRDIEMDLNKEGPKTKEEQQVGSREIEKWKYLTNPFTGRSFE